MTLMRVHILDLPFDILAVLFAELDVPEFVKLCSSCSDLYEHIDDLDFWRRVTQSRFRLPNRPSAKYDGHKWRTFHKCLSKQTRVYLWGQHSRTRGILPKEKQHLNMFNYPLSDWEEVGVIADLQIGGWSTTVLDSNGKLYTAGPMNLSWNSETGSPTFVRLKFPGESNPLSNDSSHATPGTSIPSSVAAEVLQSSKIISSCSAGRVLVIGLADDGTAWLWYRVNAPAVKLRFTDTGDSPQIEWVCAGWSQASVYIRHLGIVIWEYSRRWHDLNAAIGGFWDIPTSGEWSRVIPQSTGDGNMGKPTKHILLEKHVLFITDKGKLFCCGTEEGANTFEILEIADVIDIQGSFRNFGVFKRDGSILVLEQHFLFECERRSILPPSKRELVSLPRLIPALQDSGIVQLAFGDYHFHALHSSGRITSYGKEPDNTGSLGLCGIKSQLGSRIRGVRTGFGNNMLLPHAYFTGRSIWFNEAKNKWQSELMSALSTQGDFTDEEYLGEFSEWVEQRGSDWDDTPEAAKLDEGLGSYFALSVAAGGWSSGALVVVNDKMEEAITKHCRPPRLEELPNIRFSDGSYSAPNGPVNGWKKQPPVFTVTPGIGSVWGVTGWEWNDAAGERFSQQEGTQSGA